MIDIRNSYSNIIIILVIVLGLGVSNAYSQTLTNYAKKHKAELAEKQKVEREAYESACIKGTMDALKSFVSIYPKSKYVSEANSKIKSLELKMEKDAYDSACKEGTIEAFRDFLKRYPQSQYAQDVQDRIKDFDMWNVARINNTIQAYNSYLQNSMFKTFSAEAKAAIEDINAISEWQNVKESKNLSEIQSFIDKYPKASCISDATKKRDELLAVAYYERGNLQSAYEKFESAGGRLSIEFSNLDKYDECLEYVKYKKLSSSSTESELLAYLKEYPSSKYYNQVSNWMAIAKANNFPVDANSNHFRVALLYAKDKETKDYVQRLIDNNKRSSRQYKRHQRHSRVMANGGYVKLGAEVMDLGLSGISAGEEHPTALYYNVGLNLKFGNYKAPVQFEVSFKPGVGYVSYKSTQYNTTYYDYGYGSSYSYSDSDDEETEENFFHMPVCAKLKLNICKSYSSMLYIAGLGTYNLIRNKDYENEFSIGGGVGVAWKKWDWFVLYYKQDFGKKRIIDGKYFATSFVYYF